MSPVRALMIEHRDVNVATLAKLPLAELRRRQDINASQFTQLHRDDHEGWLTLRQIEQDLIDAIDEQVFG